MKISKGLMNKAGVMPKLRLANRQGKSVVSTGPQRVKLLEDKIIQGMDRETGKKVEYVVYTVEHDGEKKQYRTRLKNKDTGELSYLVQRMGEIPEGTDVILECKRSGIQNYIEVTPVGDAIKVDEIDEHEEAVDISG